MEHKFGIKGPSVVSLIPYFDISKGFLPDFLHVFHLGLFRTLLSLWFGTHNKDEDWYINKSQRKQLDRELLSISPPDSTMRVPRSLVDMKYYKGNEIEELFLRYFPILLRNKLKKKYYQHYLLIVYAVHNLLKISIHDREIDHSKFLIDLFLKDFKDLYDRNKLTYNAHVASHVCEYVRMYGPGWSWCTNSFEDFGGFVKSIVHGKNKIDIEIVNTLKICNSFQILSHLLNSENRVESRNQLEKFSKLSKSALSAPEVNKIAEYCTSNNLDPESIPIFSRVKLGKEVYTSAHYKNQKKRDNSHVCWYTNEKNLKYGTIQLFFKSDNTQFSIVRELVPSNDSNLFNNYIRFPRIHILVRPSYCLHIIELTKIHRKIIKIDDYVCVPEFVGKK